LICFFKEESENQKTVKEESENQETVKEEIEGYIFR
jgi:hypothetical protein